MPENTKNSQNKGKARLGRGLGSLLGGGSDLTDEKPAPTNQAAPSPPRPAPAPTQPPASATTQPAKAAPSSASANLDTNSSLNAQRPAETKAKDVSPAVSATPSPAVAVPIVAAPLQVENKATNSAPQRPIVPEESQIWMIPVDRLAPNTQQPRQVFDSEALKELTNSIKEKGILQPITARRLSERQFEIIAGERRWRAAQAAGLHEVPVILKKISEQDSLEYAIIENIQRENLNPMEEAEAYEHLMSEYSLTQQQVAEKLGKDRSTVANILRLLSLPSELKIMVRANELSPGHAKVLLALDDKNTQLEIAKQVIDDRLSVRATEKLVAKAKEEKQPQTSQMANPAKQSVSKGLIDGLANELQKLIGTKVAIDYAHSKGKLNIHFYSDDQLTQIVEKMRDAWQK